MKKVILVVLCVLATASLQARPHFGPPPHRHGLFRPMPPPPRHHHVHYSSGFWPGFVGGTLIGAAVAARPSAVVVQRPATVVPAAIAQQIWIEGRYVDVVASDGTVVRQWQPGHWETIAIPVR